jgi:hypothetical protein
MWISKGEVARRCEIVKFEVSVEPNKQREWINETKDAACKRRMLPVNKKAAGVFRIINDRHVPRSIRQKGLPNCPLRNIAAARSAAFLSCGSCLKDTHELCIGHHWPY